MLAKHPRQGLLRYQNIFACMPSIVKAMQTQLLKLVFRMLIDTTIQTAHGLTNNAMDSEATQ
jgi:hypothetical protein